MVFFKLIFIGLVTLVIFCGGNILFKFLLFVVILRSSVFVFNGSVFDRVMLGEFVDVISEVVLVIEFFDVSDVFFELGVECFIVVGYFSMRYMTYSIEFLKVFCMILFCGVMVVFLV